jgi:predicted metal-dependent hydrolase
MPAESVDSRLDEGIALFNQGDYYACHDVLEAIWMEANTPDKPFYQGILQIAVGLYHLGNHNWQGASILLGEGVNRLRAFEPIYEGVDVERLVDCGWAWLTALQQTGNTRVADVAAAVPQAQGGPDRQAVVLSAEESTILLPALYVCAPDQKTGAGT